MLTLFPVFCVKNPCIQIYFLLCPVLPAERDDIPTSNLLFYTAGVSAVFVLIILVLGMLAAKRKSKHGVLWLPEGFMAKKDDKRREPVGQDDFGMK